MNAHPPRRRNKAMPLDESQAGLDSPRAGQTTPSFLRSDSFRELRILIRRSYFDVLLVFVPAGMAAGALGLPRNVVFWLNALAVIPLAPLITMSVLELSADAGPVRGGMLRAIFGNMPDKIICVLAVIYNQTQLAKWIIVGDVLLYSLLVLGCGFLMASYDKDRVVFSKTQVSILSSLMMVVSISLVIPTVMTFTAAPEHDSTDETSALSHCIAVILVILFVSYILFRFRTHQRTFSGVSNYGGTITRIHTFSRDKIGLIFVFLLIFVSASLCTIVCGRNIIQGIGVGFEKIGFTKLFVGMVLLPLMINVANTAAIIRTCRVRADMAIWAIISNILDTLLFIVPLLVLLGDMVNQPVNLDFGLFESIIFLLAMIVMSYLLQQGKATYFEGAMLMGTYFVIAVAIYVSPELPLAGTFRLERRPATLAANITRSAV